MNIESKKFRFDLAENPPVNIKQFYDNAGTSSIIESLNKEFVGLTEVKKRIKEICSAILFDIVRKSQELPTINSTLHMTFTGQNGTGKVSVAKKMALLLRGLGHLTKGHTINVTRDDLVGAYIGHTAPKTKDNLQKAQGGILFIHAAHQLYKPTNEKDYGSEAIELLLQIMENQNKDLVFIFAGNKAKINSFFASNPGISSRIANHVDFADYKLEDLTEISKFLLRNENSYKFTEEAMHALTYYLQKLIKFPSFSNAHTIKIFLNQILFYQAARIKLDLLKLGKLPYNNLVEITKEDINFFTNTDFINIIGSTNMETGPLFLNSKKKKNYNKANYKFKTQN